MVSILIVLNLLIIFSMVTYGISSTSEEAFDYENTYHPLYEIEGEIHRMDDLHGDVIKVVKLGQTSKERDINAVIVSTNQFDGWIVVFECGIHAREWISVSFCLWTINKLINDRRLLSHYQFLIIPVLNPDG